jgi:hypothetical protein
MIVAVAPFDYEGRQVERGEVVAMWPLDAAAAKRGGLVSLTRPARAQAPPPEPPAPEKRRYRRRDLQPEP